MKSLVLFLVACNGTTQVAPTAPATVLPTGEPTPDPTPDPTPPPEPTPPPATHADFWTVHNEDACAAGIVCGSEISLGVYGCPEGIEPPTCNGYDSAAAAVCLATDWTCDELFDAPIAVPPPACGVVCDPIEDTAPPTPTPAPVSFTVTLEDGDGVADATGGDDADTWTVQVLNGTSTYEFGIAQTEAGATGWFGEDCLSGICHTLTGAVTVLDRVFSPASVSDGSTLMPVDFPVSNTTGVTYVVFDTTTATDCWVWGHDPAYYASLACMSN